MAAALFAPLLFPHPTRRFRTASAAPVPYAAFLSGSRLRRPLPVGLQLAFCLNIVCVTP